MNIASDDDLRRPKVVHSKDGNAVGCEDNESEPIKRDTRKTQQHQHAVAEQNKKGTPQRRSLAYYSIP